MGSIDELRNLGFNVEIASGSVQAEQDALDEARGLAAPERIQADVQEIADKAAADATAVAISRGISAAKIPAAVAEAVTRITAQALEHLTDARNERVAFHERALENARAMPTTYAVSGPGVTNVYVDVDDATGNPTAGSADLVAALKDPDAHRERSFQHRLREHPKAEEIWGYVTVLRDKGYTVKAEIQEDGTGLQARIGAEGQADVIADTLAKLRNAAQSLPDLDGA